MSLPLLLRQNLLLEEIFKMVTSAKQYKLPVIGNFYLSNQNTNKEINYVVYICKSYLLLF